MILFFDTVYFTVSIGGLKFKLQPSSYQTYAVCKILPSLTIKSINETISLNWHKKGMLFFMRYLSLDMTLIFNNYMQVSG